ncbi:MAG: hypothetical protein U5M50_03205 [Sphingobium sp.]|nr:hypothetical protein [Sphingobium sp.]
MTDFEGHRETLMLNSPPIVSENEHRLIIAFRARRGMRRNARRCTGTGVRGAGDGQLSRRVPAFTLRGKLDWVLAKRDRDWPGRDSLRPPHPRPIKSPAARGRRAADQMYRVLANAPFAPAIAALRNRPARREVDRRLVYIDPKPQARSFQLNRHGEQAGPDDAGPPLPGFFRTIFGALSDIPREQPIRDNLESIEAIALPGIRDMRRIIDGLRPEIEEKIEASIGRAFFLDRPTPARLSAWRTKAQTQAAVAAGFAYSAYGHLKLAAVVDDMADLLFHLVGSACALDRAGGTRRDLGQQAGRGLCTTYFRERTRASEAAIPGSSQSRPGSGAHACALVLAAGTEVVADADSEADAAALLAMHEAIYDGLARYSECELADHYGHAMRHAAVNAVEDPGNALAQLAVDRNLKALDEAMEVALAEALALEAQAERVTLPPIARLQPRYDIATLLLGSRARAGRRVIPGEGGSHRAGRRPLHPQRRGGSDAEGYRVQQFRRFLLSRLPRK